VCEPHTPDAHGGYSVVTRRSPDLCRVFEVLTHMYETKCVINLCFIRFTIHEDGNFFVN
jgi:hypothetical protein